MAAAVCRHLPPPLSNSRTERHEVTCKKAKNDAAAFEEKKWVKVDYDKGEHLVSTQLTGLRKADLSKQYRVRVGGDRFQKDWTISEVVDRVLQLQPHDDVNGLLNCWIGRFARKNFPPLIKAGRTSLSLFPCILLLGIWVGWVLMILQEKQHILKAQAVKVGYRIWVVYYILIHFFT
uniref:Uncharacterized protein MANES_08G051400 n=1 Tax=Rhizophora mucronata TaxID=61149 RepID=A0A2P2KV68_RHIMU